MLLNKITTIYYNNPNNPERSVDIFIYNDKGEMIKVNYQSGRTAAFEYDAEGKPTKTTYYTDNNTIEYTSFYLYNGKQLTNVNSIYDNPLYNRKYTLTYNSAGKLISMKLCQSENCSSPGLDTYTYNGDNISTQISEMTFASIKREYSYDNNPNPLTNNNLYHKLMTGSVYYISNNNYLSEKMYNLANGGWILYRSINYTILYNDEKFPIEVIGKDQNGKKYIEYRYEYIIK